MAITKYEGTTIRNDGARDLRVVTVPHTMTVQEVRGLFDVGHDDWLHLVRLTNPTGKWIWHYQETPPDMGGYEQRTKEELAEHFGWTHQL